MSGDDSVILLAGDVMTGRGVDQIQQNPGAPELIESYITDARGYVELAEATSGPVAAPVDPAYIWGDGLAVCEQLGPDVRIINLETSVTSSDDFWPGKGVHYRMHPSNVACLTAAGIDVCCLANNHVLDFGEAGLAETLLALRQAGLLTAGAGHDAAEAGRPARVTRPGGTVIVAAFGATTSGIPSSWAASGERPGIHLLPDLTERTAEMIGEALQRARAPGDLVIASIHWGSNWNFDVSREEIRFAHRLIETGVDVVHGHSSHHVRPIEVHQRKLILYGCGDLVTDYEGIGGHAAFRGDLGVMYFARLSRRDGALLDLRMAPMRMRRIRLERASSADTRWLVEKLGQISDPFGTLIDAGPDGVITIH